MRENKEKTTESKETEEKQIENTGRQYRPLAFVRESLYHGDCLSRL